jgi:hypothetical protein
MTLAPIKAGGWAANDRLTSAQANAIQAALLSLDAQDGSLGGTDATLAASIEVLRSQLSDAADEPEDWFHLRDDFTGAVWDSGNSRLYSAFPWTTGVVGTGALVNDAAGTSKNPGQLVVSIPGDGANTIAWYAQPGVASGNPTAFDKLDRATIVMKVADDPGNFASIAKAGLAENNSASNGGTNALQLCFDRGGDATHWLLHRRKAGTSSFVQLGAMVSNQYARCHFRKVGTGIRVYFNGTLITTIAAADIPDGDCTFGPHVTTTPADAHFFIATYDLLQMRAYIGDRSGA